MATEMGDTLAPTSNSGSGVYRPDTISVKGDNASKSITEPSASETRDVLTSRVTPVHDTNEEILRLPVKGFNLSKGMDTDWEDIVILRAGHRKVAIHLLSDQHSLLSWDEEHSLQIDLDHVMLDLSYITSHEGPPRCTLRKQQHAAPYILEFGSLRDVFKFQRVFTGYSVQVHIPGSLVRLQPKHQKKTFRSLTAIQLWSHVPDRYESLIHTQDVPRAPSHLPEIGAKRDLPGHKKYPAQTRTTTAYDEALRSVSRASSLLVLSGRDSNIRAPADTTLIRIPLDGNISIAKQDKSRNVKLVADGAKTKHQQKPSLVGALALAPFLVLDPVIAGASYAYQVAKSSKFDNSISQNFEWVKLGFRNIEDEMRFKAAFNALKDPYGSLYEAETHGSNRKSLGERGSLTRKYQSAVFDADDVIPPAKQTSANAELIPLHKAKTGQVDSSAPLSQLRRDLAGDSTNHPDGRANVFPLVAGSLGPSLESNGRNRSPDVLDADPQGATKSSVTSNEEEKMRRLRRRRICRKVVVFMLWKGEQKHGVPNELFSSPTSFDFIDGLEISQFDKIKGLFEIYSGREWDWSPFDPAAKPLESGKVRIRWQCTCGDQRWTDVSRYLARKCQDLVNENTPAGHESGNATSQSAGSAASHSHLGSVVPGSFPCNTSQPTGVTSNIHSTAQASHIQDTSKSSHSKDLYVLLCIYQGSQILHSQILASKCHNDEAFFENLRQEYRRLRGFFRYWFSPLQFSHCDFVKFTRFYVNELAKVGHSLPIDLLYQYTPRPPGPHEDPPISPHEFHRRFYTHFVNPCGRDEALERIPKRQKRFQVNLHVDGREDMWGLHVELRPCFLVVLMWQIVLTAGGWAFMGWWLSSHKGDLQNAAVPVTLLVTAIMVLWAPIRKGMTEAL